MKKLCVIFGGMSTENEVSCISGASVIKNLNIEKYDIFPIFIDENGTWFKVERIINKAINENIDIDKLLVVTFTNAAASEMRERVLDAIYKKLDEDPGNENLQRQITLLNMASICTIDSFCLDVVKNNFYELENVSPNFRIADTPEIELLKQEILDVMVNVDVSIDYPEYDVEDVTNSQISEMLDSVQTKLEILEKSFDNGKLIKEGIKTAIIGKPNAGKSSLLNAILKEDRAIVTEYEGTTRDTIEEFVNIEGVPLKLIDTAGIRDAKDEVEKIGIKKSKEIANDADLVIAIFDSSKELTVEDEEILNIIKNKKSIILLNKADLNSVLTENDAKFKEITENVIKISALNGVGLEKLYNLISKMFSLEEINVDNDVIVTNLRHKNLISKAIENVKKAKNTVQENMPIDIIAIFIKDILEDLGNITGEIVTDDIINEIFSKFCLGK